jgi:cell division protein FtsZ
VNLDFADVKTVMAERGNALMGAGLSTGPNRAYEAAQSAVQSPLLDDISIAGAEALLVNVTGGESMTLHEINEAVSVVVDAAGRDANVIFGAVVDDSMGDAISITVIATGFGREAKAAPAPAVAPARAAAGPRIYEMETGRPAPKPALVRPTLEPDEMEPAASASLDEAKDGEGRPAEPTGRPAFKIAPGTARRPFGGRVLTRDNMDVPAFMRKQMD